MRTRTIAAAIAGCLALIALTAIAPAVAAPSTSAATSRQSAFEAPPTAPPVVLAQGRCFNGRCY